MYYLLTTTYQAGTIYSHFTKEETDPERLNNLPWVTQLLSNRDRLKFTIGRVLLCPSVAPGYS